MFWLIAILLAILVAALIVLALLRPGRNDAAESADMRIYRDQLDEVERDLARGLLARDEAERVRIEVSRRLLDADRAAEAGTEPRSAPRGLTVAMAVISTVVVVGGGLGIYTRIGAPGYPDLPLQSRIEMANEARRARPEQATAEADAAETVALAQADVEARADPSTLALIDRLRETLAERPDDLRGFILLARNEAGLARFSEAAAAQARVVALKGEEAGPEDLTDLAEYLIYAAGGYVSPEAEKALVRALQMDNGLPRARYYTGLLYAQTGRPDLAFRLWRGLLETGPQDAPWIPGIRARIGALADLAGVNYAPPVAPGPSPEDLAAAAELSAPERQQMIEGMVAGLSDRLASQGGPVEEWSRLIVALGVLGQTERAEAILEEALGVFASDAVARESLRAAAERVGLGP